MFMIGNRLAIVMHNSNEFLSDKTKFGTQELKDNARIIKVRVK